MSARTEIKLAVGSLVAAADLSAKQHYLVKISAANTVNLAGDGEAVFGVLLNKPTAGQACEIGVGVILPVIAGDAVAAGASVAADATGRAVTATEGEYIFGIAVEAAGAAGRQFAVRVGAQQASDTADASAAAYPVAATMEITAGEMVCLDADGFLVAADEATAVSFWGYALETVDNSGGADGDETCLVRRSGLVDLTGVGLVDTDVGKECWVSDATTITTTPGTILVGVIDSIASATEPTVRIKPLPIVGQRTDRQHVIAFAHSGATLNGKSAFTDREFKRRYICLSMMADAETAPGGTDTLTCTLTDGTKTYAAVISATATHGENKTPQTFANAMKANFDTDLTLVDTATTTADVKGEVLVEDL